MPRGKKSAEKTENMKPYEGKRSLPDPDLDSKGNKKRFGEARYFINRKGDVYKLIAVFKKPAGLDRRLVKVLMPRKRTDRGKQDKIFLEKLKKAGIPGAE